MPFKKVGDINMYYEIHGEGEPLVTICEASATIESYPSRLSVFANDYQVIFFNNSDAG